MKLKFKPFDQFVKMFVVPKTVARAHESIITYLDVSNATINARVRGTKLYTVQITFNAWEVVKSACSCPYEPNGYCKHIVNVLVHADRILNNRKVADSYQQVSIFDVDNETVESETVFIDPQSPETFIIDEDKKINLSVVNHPINKQTDYTIADKHILALTQEQIFSVSDAKLREKDIYSDFKIQNAAILPNKINVIVAGPFLSGKEKKQGEIELIQSKKNIKATCSCNSTTKTLCQHVYFVLLATCKQHLYFHWAFEHEQRQECLREHARQLGIPNLEQPDEIYSLFIPRVRLSVIEKVPLFSSQIANFNTIVEQFEQTTNYLPTAEKNTSTDKQEFILLKTDDKYDGTPEINVWLMEAPLSKTAPQTMKNPIQAVTISQRFKNVQDKKELMFLSSFLTLLEGGKTQQEKTEAYCYVLKNPLQLPVYRSHAPYEWQRTTRKINVSELTKVELLTNNYSFAIHVRKHVNKGLHEFYAVDLTLDANKQQWTVQEFELIDAFVFVEKHVVFVQNMAVLETILLFKAQNASFLVHKAQLSDFQEKFIRPVESYIQVVYDFAYTPKTEEIEANKEIKRLVYLSESDDYILITPTVRYQDEEVAVFSQKNIYREDANGNIYAQKRDWEIEQQFIELLQGQHPTFEQRPSGHFFYLHYSEFLNDLWFQHAFQTWKEEEIEVLGFKKLKHNYNPNKMAANVSIASKIDWFDLETEFSFGNQHVSLKDIQRSIINKNRFVVLGDGTKGILPEEWVRKFERYFRNGEIKNGNLRIHKSNFQLIDELFEKETLPQAVQIELGQYLQKLSEFQSIQQTEPPKKLRATLRDYQKEGVNWLNFLYEFNFGGCLADDMGLGKTVQIIAYLLSRQEKGNSLPNLVIMPTSLLFNWQHEIEKFAPHLRYCILYGTKRQTKTINFSEFDLILTSYGTMLSDIDIVRKQQFDVIVLDESQAIKNPGSKRYKAVQLLQGKQRIVATGTPVENNTFDLYAQLSFAMPGLLGTQKNFASNYSTPIDKFQDEQRAKELHQKIHPFVLRRTKQQVATELPEKTEITIYCPMDKHQQKVYDTYRAEFQRYLSGLSDDQLNKSALNVLQGLTKLRQICNSPALLSDEEFYGDESAKINELILQIDRLKDNHKILVFSQFVSMLDLIQKRLDTEEIKCAYLTGQTKNRQQQVELFQNDPSIRVFLISLKAGGTGLNLTEAEYVFIVDPWWNPAVENQAIDRAYRIGQKNKVMAMRLITPNTIEEKIMELQQRKSQIAQDLIHTDDQLFKRLTKEDLMNIV